MTALLATLGVVLGAAGVWVVLRLRFAKRSDAGQDADERDGESGLRLPGVGRVSRVSVLVIGLALLGAGYHLFTHALGLMARFRAPLGIALGVAAVAIIATLAVDKLENRLEGKGPGA